MRPLLIVVALLVAGPARAADYAFAEPTDIRAILVTIAAAGGVNLIVGTGVEGLTTYVARDRDPEAAIVEAAVGAGFTIRKRDNLLAVRVRGIHPSRVDEDPPRTFRPDDAITLRFPDGAPARAIVGDLARQLGVPFRLHRQARAGAIVMVDRVHPRTFLNVFAEAMGLGWGVVAERATGPRSRTEGARSAPAATRRILVLAPWDRAPHFVIEMGVDNRAE